jgi:plasmid stabilization system protein ParE
MRVVWSPLALERAVEIARWIATDRPRAARAWMDGLFDAVGGLAGFPERGRVVSEIGRLEIREIAYRDHRVICKVEPRRVSILTVRHGRRLFDPGDVVAEP